MSGAFADLKTWCECTTASTEKCVPCKAVAEHERLEERALKLRNALFEMRGYLKLWSNDVNAGLKPTNGSLSDAWHLMATTLGDKQ